MVKISCIGSIEHVHEILLLITLGKQWMHGLIGASTQFHCNQRWLHLQSIKVQNVDLHLQ